MNTQADKVIYEQAILSYLQGKYQEEFTIRQIYQEFAGDTGVLIRATCVSQRYPDLFTVRCYLDPAVAAYIVLIDGRSHSIEDNYAEVLCQNQLLQALTAEVGEHLFLKCRVDFHNRQPMQAEYANGWEACLCNEELRAYIKIYILSDGNEQAQYVYDQAEKLVQRCQSDTGYIYYGVCDPFDAAAAEEIYRENQNDFGNYLFQREYARSLWFTLYKSQTGLQCRKQIKG